jgi:two-component system, chemotaxis family, chemotaxis protein CheY
MIHVLVVDDELDVQMLFQQRFRKEIRTGEYEFAFAMNADAALDYMQTNIEKVNFVLSDINMPGKTGLELLACIKETYKAPPPNVMMITAYGDEASHQKAIQLGADDFFTKPLDFSKLKERINNF